MDQTTLNAVRVQSAIKSGSSVPIVIEDGLGKRFLVKLRGGTSGEYANISEWIACKLGSALDLPVLQPCLVTLNSATEMSHIYIEVRELILKSLGLNLAFPFLENATDLKSQDLAVLSSDTLTRLFFFDVFWLNIDRNPKHTNLLKAGEQFIAFDYETSFLLQGILSGQTFFKSNGVAQQLRQNPLFTAALTEERFLFELQRLKMIDFKAIVESIPNEWLSENPSIQKQQLMEGLNAAAQNPEPYLSLISNLQSLLPESEEDRIQRMLDNRLRFEQQVAEQKETALKST